MPALGIARVCRRLINTLLQQGVGDRLDRAVANRGIFKADIESRPKAYDDAVESYAEALEGKKRLVDVLNGMFGNLDKTSADQDKLKADRDKSDEDIDNNKNWTQADNYRKQPDADPTEVLKTLTDFSVPIEKSLNLHKKVLDRIVASGFTMIDVIKKGRDDYKVQADKVTSTPQKAYDDSDEAQGGILSALTDFMETADEIENADPGKQLQSLYKPASS